MNQQRIEKAKQSRLYRAMQNVSKFADRYYLDAAVGFIPGGVGDALGALFSLVYAYFAAFRLRSAPLTLAVLNNALRDFLLGMIPFYVGDVVDFFHRANTQNMALVDGFINGDEQTIRRVNRKAAQAAVVLALFILAIALMFWLLYRLVELGLGAFS